LGAGKEEGIVDAVPRPVIEPGGGVDGEASGIVAGCQQDLVHHAFAEGVDVIERAGLVGTVIEPRNGVVGCRERVVFVIKEVHQAEADVVLVRGDDVQVAAVDLLVGWVLCNLQEVGGAYLKVRRGVRKGGEQCDAVGTQTTGWDDVAGEAACATGLGIAGQGRLRVFDVGCYGAEVARLEGRVRHGDGIVDRLRIVDEGLGV
jgi:hypothetical protein